MPNSWRARYHRRYDNDYYYRNTYVEPSGPDFPNYYPNIKYFRMNGHVYYKNLDTGEVYLSQW